ncbi:hypothetical protein [Gilliamella sp. ESL0254]|uniref:hypothetical protein n=1 Tax=Gilliamella sp. ESL0254 TaxID=2705035 RepID=UPI001580CEB1|nr:hypothetical protein [Gilliamella sp. ESL0254]NUF27373.1 hypothetical protein [Gilliamella sp. ESL0254]
MASGIWHLACQTYAQNLFQFHRSLNQTQFLFSSAKSFRVAKWTPSSRSLLAMFSAGTSATSLETSSETALVRSSATSSAKLSSISKWLLKPPLVYKPPLWFRASLLSKSELFFASLLLLSYTQGSVALTPCSQPFMACTSRVIEGSAPYLTFDGGQTKATDTDTFLAIELPNGRTITPSTNTSSSTNPIMLPNGNFTFNDIHMVIPSGSTSTSLNSLIRQGKWGDDDGDGQGANGVTASGDIWVVIYNKDGRTVSRGETLSKCRAPYKVTLVSTGGYLQTQYGVPNRTSFSGATVDYYINPYDSGSGGCYFVSHARPNLISGTGNYAGPANIWNPDKGFLTQSTDSSSYDRNFPTTGANGLYFDLEMPAGVDGRQLSWTVNTNGSLGATVSWVKPNSGDNWIRDRFSYVTRVTLRGPSQISVPSLPQKFELVGRDRSGNEVRYGFVLKQWFVHRGSKLDNQSNHSSWCRSLGYRLSQVKDLTNSTALGASPRSSGNYYMRHIGSGFFTEWGDMRYYAVAGFVNVDYCTSDAAGGDGFVVDSYIGHVSRGGVSYIIRAVCTTP